MSQVRAVTPQSGIGDLLPGAHFIDAYQVLAPGGALHAREAARLMLGEQPGWVRGLMGLRNAIVAPLGLKTGREGETGLDRIGIFPILSETPARVVLGFADRHLDFRVVVDVRNTGPGQEVTASTLVRLNNTLGRLYLTTIMPFHRLIVRNSLARVAAAAGRA